MTTGRSGRAVALVMLLACLAGCGGSLTTAGRAAPQAATATPTGLLPAFTDWRIASLAGPGAPLHVLTLDGKSDLTGPTLAASAHNLMISPNGRTIAYLTAPKYGPITLLELDARTLAASVITVPASVSSLFGEAWSPDGSRLAVSGTLNGATGLYLMDAHTGHATQVPGTGSGGANSFLGFQDAITGWTDATHVVLTGGRLGAIELDVSSGQTRALSIPEPLGITRIAPGGRQALLVASCGACCTVAPDVAVYDFASGAIRHLPAITAATDGQGTVLWQPGTSLAVGLLHPTQLTAFNPALFDLATDTVTPLQPNMLPQAWLPDGQTLLLASHPADGTNGALYTENPVAPSTQPIPLPTSITNVIGFVRTAGGAATGNAAPQLARNPAPTTTTRSVALLSARWPALPHCG